VINQKGEKVFVAKEESDDCMRCCCAPHHEFVINVNDRDGNAILSYYHPFKCGCCACMDICRDEMYVYEGKAKVDSDWRKDNEDKLRGLIKMPTCGGCITPTWEVFSVVDKVVTEKPEAEITGPTLFIGACCDSKFTMQPPGANQEKGMYGSVVKEGMDGLESAAVQMFSDAQNFQLKFQKEPTESNELLNPFMYGDWNNRMWGRAKLLGGLFALDYKFFEDGGIFECFPDPDTVCALKCCDMYCAGCIIPCKLTLMNSKKDGD
jgi:hypothetical protein